MGIRRGSAVWALRALIPTGFLFVGGMILGVVPALPGLRGSGDAANQLRADHLFVQGRQVFRFDTFGDEAFWSGALQLNRAIAGAQNGGVGPGVSPKTALALGLKVDVDALPKKLRKQIAKGQVNLDDPGTTLALVKLNAVVGVKGTGDLTGGAPTVGITCALCHSVVDNSFAPGIGHRLDGWPNRDLNVGAIVAASPNLTPVESLLGVDEATVRAVLASWGPGKFDAELFLDGKAFQPNGTSAATLIPAAFGLAGVNLHTYTGWGSVPYWNAFVANLEMHGKGNFFDPRLDDAQKFPIAARNGFGHVRNNEDLISAKLPALHAYQVGLAAPSAPRGSFDVAAAARGKALFEGKATCSGCHMQPTFTEPGWNLHTPSEICTDAFQADRSPTGMYRTTPLPGLFARAKGGFYHDGRFGTLGEVVDHYDGCFGLALTAGEKSDLVEFLKSL